MAAQAYNEVAPKAHIVASSQLEARLESQPDKQDASPLRRALRSYLEKQPGVVAALPRPLRDDL